MYKNVIAFLLLILMSCSAFSAGTGTQKQSKQSQENVVAQMNYCINSLTNIIHNKSIVVLDHESDQIINNLTMEQIVGLYEINDFRIDLFDAISQMQITEEERMLMRRLQSIKRDNLKWQALSNALSPTIMVTGGTPYQMAVQAGVQVLLTAARTAVEYQASKGEQNIEELRAMWDLRKSDLEDIANVRKSAIDIVFSLFNKYHLSEKDRLTERTANAFCNYISEPDAKKRIRQLEDNRETYKHFASYYYYLGMAYIDAGQYEKAKTHLDTYLRFYNNTPIFRHDEKSGCIALAKLANEPKLSAKEKENLIRMACENLPDNGAAILQCAMVYIYDLKQEEKGLELLRSGIDNPQVSDKDALYMAAANLMPIIVKYPEIKDVVDNEFNTGRNVDFESYITYLLSGQKNAWKSLKKVFQFEKYNYRKWYKLWIGKHFNNNLHIIIPERLAYEDGDMSVFIENHGSEKIAIKQLNVEFANAITQKQINKVDCFKADSRLKYLFVDVIVPEKLYSLKHNLDLDKIKDEEWPGMSKFIMSEDTIEEIVDFCKEYMPDNFNTNLKCDESDGDVIDIEPIDGIAATFKGDSLMYVPTHSSSQKGDYLRLVLKNGINIVYHYNDSDNELKPYLYTINDSVVYPSSWTRVQSNFCNFFKKYSWTKLYSQIFRFIKRYQDIISERKK